MTNSIPQNALRQFATNAHRQEVLTEMRVRRLANDVYNSEPEMAEKHVQRTMADRANSLLMQKHHIKDVNGDPVRVATKVEVGVVKEVDSVRRERVNGRRTFRLVKVPHVEFRVRDLKPMAERFVKANENRIRRAIRSTKNPLTEADVTGQTTLAL